MKKIILVLVALGLIFGLAGCSSEADKKAQKVVGVWSYTDPAPKDQVIWNRYFVVKKMENSKDLFEIKEFEYAIKGDGGVEKGKIKQYRNIAKIDGDGVLRLHGTAIYLEVNSEGNELVESGKNRYSKIKNLPEELQKIK